MNYIIFPSDPSINFMSDIVYSVNSEIYKDKVSIIICEANNDSYREAREAIKNIPEGANVIFIGHSTPSLIYGGKSDDFERKSLFDLKEMKFFREKKLFFISCFSSKILLIRSESLIEPVPIKIGRPFECISSSSEKSSANLSSSVI